MPENRISIREWTETLLSVFFPRLGLLIFVPLCCGLLTAAVCLFLPSVYQGKFSLLITAPEIDKTIFESDVKMDVTPGVVKTNLILDEIYILGSHALHEKVALCIQDKESLITGYWQTALPQIFAGISETKDKAKSELQALLTGAAESEPPAEPPLEAFASGVGEMCTVETLRDSDIIEIRCRHHKPELIKKVLDAYVVEYHNLRNAIWFEKDAPNFFQKHSLNYFEQWQSLLEKLVKLGEMPDLIDPVQEKARLETQLMEYNAEMLNLKITFGELGKQEKILKYQEPGEAVSFTSNEIEKDSMLKAIRQQIGSVVAKRLELLRDFQPGAPLVRKLDYQIEELYFEYKRLITNFFQKEIRKNRIRRDAISSAAKEIRSRLGKLNRRLSELDKHRYEFKMLEDKLRRYEKQYAEYETKAMRVNLQEELRKTVTTVRVVSPPFVSQKAVWPRKLLLVILAMMLGFLFAIFFVLVSRMMDDSFHLPREVSRELDLPVLASFPLIRRHKNIIGKPLGKTDILGKLGFKKRANT